jgi:uncharacterized membrane protein YccC
VELLYRFVRELHTYSRTYATLLEKEDRSKPLEDVRFVFRTDPVVALLTGGRAFAAILLVGAFWIASAWPYGSSALTFVATVCALFSMAPDPSRAARRMTVGFTAGFFAALLFEFFVLPSLTDFVLLSAGLVPVLLAGLYLSTHPKWADAGAGFIIFFTTMLAPSNSMVLNQVAFLNEGGATIMGILVAVLMFETLVPTTGKWLKHRLARQLRHQVVMACFDPLPGLTHRFESGTYELLYRLASTSQEKNAKDQQLLSWMFPVIEIGRAVIHLRQDVGSIPTSQSISDRIQLCIRSTVALFRRPSASARSAAIESVADCAAQLRLAAEAGECPTPVRKVLSRMQTSLHLIRCALLDVETMQIAVAVAPATPLTEGIPHAA